MVPVAATLKAANCPTFTVTARGCAVIAGAIVTDVTVSVATLLVATPAELRTITKYVLPLSASVADRIVYTGLFVAPGAGTLLVALPFLHS